MASDAMDNPIRPRVLTNYLFGWDLDPKLLAYRNYLFGWDLDPKLLAYRTFPVAAALPNYQIIVNACICVVFVLLCLFSCLFLCCSLFFCSVFVLCYPRCRVFVLLLLKDFSLPSLQGFLLPFLCGFYSLCYVIFMIFNEVLLIIKKKKKKN